MDPQLKYAGEAICLVGIAFRLLRWAFDAVREGDAAPSAYPADLTLPGSASPQGVGAALSTLVSGGPGLHVNSMTFSNKFNIPLSPSGSPELPPELAAQLTPDLRAKVLESLAKMQAGSPSLHFAANTSFTTHLGSTSTINPDLFPPEMLAAMTPEQRAKVLEAAAMQAKKGQG